MSNKLREIKQVKLEESIKTRYNLTIEDISKFISKKSRKRDILTEEEIFILSHKFGINGVETKHTLIEIGKKLNYSESGISRKMHIALLKIYSVKY